MISTSWMTSNDAILILQKADPTGALLVEGFHPGLEAIAISEQDGEIDFKAVPGMPSLTTQVLIQTLQGLDPAGTKVVRLSVKVNGEYQTTTPLIFKNESRVLIG